MKDAEQELNALESLIVDNLDLERLEALLDQFNIFEAIGAARVELRHSDFLAFLLNPSYNHGLGDVFVKKLLQKALTGVAGSDLPITPIDLDVWSLDELEVRREWQNIDILLLDETHQFAVVIENKVVSGEHSGQLQRYRKIVTKHYPDWRIVYLFLTPEGDEPSDENYIPIDYGQICELVENFVESRASTLGPDVRTLMIHYAQMLRRHIVSESEIAELCQRIYRKHQRALELIYEHRPDIQEEIREALEQMIEKTPGVSLDHTSKTYIRFFKDEWDVPILMSGQGWTRSGRMLLFEFVNSQDKLRLKLLLGPGPEDLRSKVFNIAEANQPPFKNYQRSLRTKWNTLYLRSILTPESYEDVSIDDLKPKILNNWEEFIENDLPAINAVLREQSWIWEGK